jgi:ribosomal-protein-alanine N-acetyltransferase
MAAEPSATIVYRAMTADDLERVLEIEHVAYSMPWARTTFEGLLARQDADLLVAVAGRQVVGYAVCWSVMEQAELGNIAVAPEWRRQGVATQLLERVLRRQTERGVREIFLEVRTSNTVAQELYQRYGFRQIGRRAGYYSGPIEDALVMRRELG